METAETQTEMTEEGWGAAAVTATGTATGTGAAADPEKHAFVLEGPYDDVGIGATSTVRGCAEVAALLRANDRSHALLELCKNTIPVICTTRTKRWDECKRATNLYELVHTGSSSSPGVATHEWGVPTSRSFYKMWEVLHDYRAELGVDRDTPMRAAFLAEGPGGFIEAFSRYRGERDGAHVDALFGMTLVLPRNRNVPSWKVTLPSVEVHLHAGDLYEAADIDAFVCAAGGDASCDLVTADGGFDFSHDFNAQERVSTRLIVSEIYAALRLQKDGGHFLLKIYDVRTTTTIRLLYLLRRCYHSVRLLKPCTSRPANSEKYVLCTGFRRRERERLLFGPIDYRLISSSSTVAATPVPACGVPGGGAMGLLRATVASGTAQLPPPGTLAAAHALPSPPAAFVMDLVHFNLHFATRQAECIARTLVLAHQDHPAPSDEAAPRRRQQQVTQPKMKQADLKKIEAVRTLLSKCSSNGCPPSVIADADSRLAKISSGAKVAKRAPNAFAKFVKTAYPRLKRDHPKDDAPSIMKRAAKEWASRK